MQTISGTISGRARLIVDGDNINARTVAGSFSASFSKTIELKDLDAPENQGGGSAQPTGGNFSGQPGDGG